MSHSKPPLLSDVASATRWLEGLINLEARPSWPYERLSLAPIESLLAALEHPERGLCVVHIAGSKGKGSTALLVEAVLRACGRRVGTFTSPHLERWTERFRIDGAEVPDGPLIDAINRVRPAVEALRQDPARRPSFFDATTAVAWCVFQSADIDIAVLEVGLGGRLDSTNAVRPAVTCITSIELEHTDKLGNTVAAIAAEKAGILKPSVPAVLGPLPPEAMTVVERRAELLGVPLARLGQEIELKVMGDAASPTREIRLRDGPLRLAAKLPLLGAHQATNAALAVACARRALADALPPDDLAAAARAALGKAKLPARLEILGQAPRVLVDSAHTRASAASLAEVLATPAGPVHLVLSISRDKDVEGLLETLLPHADRVTVTRAEPHRSLPAEDLAELVRAQIESHRVHVEPDPELALRRARENLDPHATLCATGSIYLAGVARRVLLAAQDEAAEEPAPSES